MSSSPVQKLGQFITQGFVVIDSTSIVKRPNYLSYTRNVVKPAMLTFSVSERIVRCRDFHVSSGVIEKDDVLALFQLIEVNAALFGYIE